MKFDLLGTKPIPVTALVSYPSWNYRETAFRDQDFNAHFFVHAVKNDSTKIGNRRVNIIFRPGEPAVQINRDNLHLVQRYFARHVAQCVRKAAVRNPVFVAIPNRNALLDTRHFNTAGLAAEAQAAFGAGSQAYDGLRFRKFVEKDGQRQTISQLVANMALIRDVPDGEIVIVDDVYTIGRHISAAISLLPRRPVMAVVAGRTVKEPLENMLAQTVGQHYC